MRWPSIRALRRKIFGFGFVGLIAEGGGELNAREA
jgi:hypothetical protein